MENCNEPQGLGLTPNRIDKIIIAYFFVVNIRVEEDKWKKFKLLAKHNHSDASKEIRKFIDRYLSEHSQLFLQIDKKERK